MFVLMLNVGAYSQVKFEKNEYAEFESSVLVGDDPINLPESAALVERMKIFFQFGGAKRRKYACNKSPEPSEYYTTFTSGSHSLSYRGRHASGLPLRGYLRAFVPKCMCVCALSGTPTGSNLSERKSFATKIWSRSSKPPCATWSDAPPPTQQ